MIETYRKLPVEIQAIELDSSSLEEILSWCECECWTEGVDGEDNPVLYIKTLEGVMKANTGDFIIKGVNGEFYPCKPNIFHKTYELV